MLGNERDAANLQRLKDLDITYVLNVTSHLPQHFENHGIKYKRIPASDSGQQNLRQYFEEAGSFIGRWRLLITLETLFHLFVNNRNSVAAGVGNQILDLHEVEIYIT